MIAVLPSRKPASRETWRHRPIPAATLSRNSGTPAEVGDGLVGARPERRMKVLILGGYGTFGGRLARLLADEPALTLLIAGRSHAKAATFCGELVAKAECRP